MNKQYRAIWWIIIFWILIYTLVMLFVVFRASADPVPMPPVQYPCPLQEWSERVYTPSWDCNITYIVDFGNLITCRAGDQSISLWKLSKQFEFGGYIGLVVEPIDKKSAHALLLMGVLE
jgi:hypothetical protein